MPLNPSNQLVELLWRMVEEGRLEAAVVLAERRGLVGVARALRKDIEAREWVAHQLELVTRHQADVRR